jgi:hypothetical protein
MRQSWTTDGLASSGAVAVATETGATTAGKLLLDASGSAAGTCMWP